MIKFSISRLAILKALLSSKSTLSISMKLIFKCLFFLFQANRMASENRFAIKTHDNASLFLASEGSTPRDRLLFGSSRAFMMHLMDKQHQEALTLRRVFGCHCFCFPVKKQALEVWLQSGILLGVICEKFSFTSREFVIESERGEILYRVSVSLSSSLCMPKEHHFKVIFKLRIESESLIN